MIKINVPNRWTHEIQFTAEVDCTEDAPLSLKLGLAVKWGVQNKADLRSADLRSADLGGANLGGANLGSANLRSANLGGANLGGADLGGANLGGANLGGANLGGANLGGADLGGANLGSANLRSANLGGANLGGAEGLRPFKADLWLTLSEIGGPAEVVHLIHRLRDGLVDGSTYNFSENACGCLVATIAQAKHYTSVSSLSHDSNRPAERWFLMINPGDKPGTLSEVDGKETGGAFAARMAIQWAVEWCKAHNVDPDGKYRLADTVGVLLAPEPKETA